MAGSILDSGFYMSYKTTIALFTAIFLWASAFVGIRAGLQDYSPEGLALLRYLIASVCMGFFYFRLPRTSMTMIDRCALLGIGALGIGIYNLSLNYGELSISSGMSSFIISQAPIITACFAIIFLGEQLNAFRALGFTISLLGVIFIALGEKESLKLHSSIAYILIATLAGASYSVMQKPFLKKYHALEATAYIIWGGTLFLSFYASHLATDLFHASAKATLTVVYLGVFPAAIGYAAWSYVLANIPVSRAVSFFYFTPFIATLLGWLYLNEVPAWLSILGGLIAMIGVWFVNYSYKVSSVLIANNIQNT